MCKKLKYLKILDITLHLYGFEVSDIDLIFTQYKGFKNLEKLSFECDFEDYYDLTDNYNY